MYNIPMELNFCRRCGKALTHVSDNVFKCTDGHIIFRNSSPAVVLILVNERKEPLVAVREVEPGKGKLHVAAGFCTDVETIEETLRRELLEELGLSPDDYSPPQYLLSHVEAYEYKGEVIPVLCATFWATVRSTAKLVAGDDLSQPSFKPYTDLDFSLFQFETVVLALKKLHQLGTI